MAFDVVNSVFLMDDGSSRDLQALQHTFDADDDYIKSKVNIMLLSVQ